MEDTIDKQTAYKALAESIRLALDGKQNWGDVLDALKVVDNIEECESPMTDKNLYRIWGLIFILCNMLLIATKGA